MPAKNLKNLYNKPVEDCLSELNSSLNGLSSEEVRNRLKIYGLNDVKTKEEHIIIKFFKKFLRPIQLMILFAAIISLIVGHIDDFYIISCLLLINVFIEFFQEYKAENVIKMLKNKLATKVEVLRDGKWIDVDIRFLVPGDIVKIRQGNVVPADLKVIRSYNLQVDESALTGESLPVEKNRDDMIYAGSIVKTGEGMCLVVSTGEQTYYGKVITSLEEIKHESVVEEFVFDLGKFLIRTSILLILVVSLYLYLTHNSLYNILLFSLTLAVASIPAALPAVLSVVSSMGVLQLSKKHVLVRRLSSLEDLASIQVFLSDKTGTLTENKIRVAKIIPINHEEKEVINYAYLCSEDEEDPIDSAIIDKANEFGINKKEYKILNFIPADSERKRATITIEIDSNIFTIVKGSPKKLLDLSKLSENERKRILEIVEDLAKSGYRSIAVGISSGKEEEGLEIIGIIALWDPPRKEARMAVETLRKMGVEVKLVTGDHAEIAREIAKHVGIGTRVMTKKELDKIDDEKLTKIVEDYNIFAEVLPSDKLRIAKAFQKRGYVVSVMGDGINDVPALKQANVGITVNNATDAARHAADIVLTRPGIHVVLDAIKEGRKIYERIKNYSIYRTSENVWLIGLVAIMTIMVGSFVLTPIQLVLLAILNDIPILTIAIDKVKEPRSPALFKRKPLFALSSIFALAGIIESLTLYYLLIRFINLPLKQLQAIFFLNLVLSGHFLLLCVRNREQWYKYFPHYLLLTALLCTEIIATIFILLGIFTPKVHWVIVLFLWIYCFVWMQIMDLIKLIAIHKFKVEV